VNLQTVIQETAAAIDHQYQAGVCVGGSPYIRALELEAQLYEFAERVAELETHETTRLRTALRLVS
jgi:hypothetical protein